VDPFGALDVATAGFARTLALVQAGQWEAETPNPGWTVRDLVNHVVGGNRRYVLLLAGAPTEEVEALRDLDHLTDDPYADFVSTSAAVSTAFRAPGSLKVIVHHRLGDRTGAELLVMRIAEHALHGWDLARAIGADENLDDGVVETLLTATQSNPAWLTRAGYVPLADTERLAGPNLLLSLTGRA
jgi:uncharacterized protein (TIGR03086 family)